MVQTVGRMARKGQLHERIVDLITVHTTADDWMFGLSESKGLAASALFDRVDRIKIQAEDGESWELGQDNPLALQADTVAGSKKAEDGKTRYIQHQSKRRLDRQSEIPLKPKSKASRVDSPSQPNVDETDNTSTVAELGGSYEDNHTWLKYTGRSPQKRKDRKAGIMSNQARKRAQRDSPRTPGPSTDRSIDDSEEAEEARKKKRLEAAGNGMEVDD